MKYFEDEEYIEKELYDADINEIDKFLDDYFDARRSRRKK